MRGCEDVRMKYKGLRAHAVLGFEMFLLFFLFPQTSDLRPQTIHFSPITNHQKGFLRASALKQIVFLDFKAYWIS